jgi:hypothetical protein
VTALRDGHSATQTQTSVQPELLPVSPMHTCGCGCGCSCCCGKRCPKEGMCIVLQQTKVLCQRSCQLLLSTPTAAAAVAAAAVATGCPKGRNVHGAIANQSTVKLELMSLSHAHICSCGCGCCCGKVGVKARDMHSAIANLITVKQELMPVSAAHTAVVAVAAAAPREGMCTVLQQTQSTVKAKPTRLPAAAVVLCA